MPADSKVTFQKSPLKSVHFLSKTQTDIEPTFRCRPLFRNPELLGHGNWRNVLLRHRKMTWKEIGFQSAGPLAAAPMWKVCRGNWRTDSRFNPRGRLRRPRSSRSRPPCKTTGVFQSAGPLAAAPIAATCYYVCTVCGVSIRGAACGGPDDLLVLQQHLCSLVSIRGAACGGPDFAYGSVPPTAHKVSIRGAACGGPDSTGAKLLHALEINLGLRALAVVRPNVTAIATPCSVINATCISV